jgi:hypothetical protein
MRGYRAVLFAGFANGAGFDFASINGNWIGATGPGNRFSTGAGSRIEEKVKTLTFAKPESQKVRHPLNCDMSDNVDPVSRVIRVFDWVCQPGDFHVAESSGAACACAALWEV